MMYSDKFVVAIKHNGKILREFKDVAYLPFGQEYSILLKNLNSRKALVRVSIDGTDVGGGVDFVVNGNSDLELKRFIKNGNLCEGNAFKFIERTESIENHRGIKVDDGIVRVEFWFEREVVQPYYDPRSVFRSFPNQTYDSYSVSSSTQNISTNSAQNCVKTAQLSQTSAGGGTQAAHQQSDAGITVPGSKVDQQFVLLSHFLTENESHVIILRLVGDLGQNKVVEKPVTVRTKKTCVTCGRHNKATSKFCSNCGTSLEII